jgi:hypothetical protein
VTPARLFTVDEANDAVPRLAHLVGRLQQGALRLRDEMRAAGGDDAAPLATDELLRARPAARALVEELDAIVTEIETMGAVLKDLELGLVDFPTQMNGEVVHLCWQFGEPEVAFWHPTSEGFAARQPVPGVRRQPVLQ